jgi:hypothetical protein
MREIAVKDVSSANLDWVLTVDLTRRLPDIDRLTSLPDDLEYYGRFALLQSGILWFGDIHSSHPGTSQARFYWAVGDRTLFISPDGSTLGWQELINAKTVRFIAAKLDLRKQFRFFTVTL